MNRLRFGVLTPSSNTALRVPVLDTTATVVWKMLRMTGQGGTPVAGWGRLMEGELNP